MQNSMIVFLINDNVRAIKAEYELRGTAEIFKTMDPDVKVDDLVVVQSGTRHEMTVVKVTETDVDLDFDNGPAVKWVVQKIDGNAFSKLKAMEQDAITTVQAAEKRRKKAELRERMFKDHEEQMKALQLTHTSEDDATTE